jgi:hypothetical protein
MRRFKFVEPAGYVLGEDVGATDTVNEYWIEKMIFPDWEKQAKAFIEKYPEVAQSRGLTGSFTECIDDFCVNFWAQEI